MRKINTKYIIMAAMVLLFTTLGMRPMWTMENRWAGIILNMLYTGDYLHPYLAQQEYYDKPLLSYWLMVPFVKLLGVNTWALRLPGAIAAGISLWSVYQLAKQLWNDKVAIIATWILLTSLSFLFWARVASADILNVAGILLALLIYQKSKVSPNFKSYSVFSIVLALTMLCKGVVAVAVLAVVLLPDLLYRHQWRKHLSFSLLISIFMGLFIYLIPFWLSAHYNQAGYEQSGLWQVFRENFVRFFQPFDHQGKWYLYFYMLPIYLFPWIFFFIPAVFCQIKKWHELPWNSRWILLATVLLFLFFTLSQSRRSYYIFPLLPFAALVTANWLVLGKVKKQWIMLAKNTLYIFLVLYLLAYCVLTPLYYFSGGHKQFGAEVRQKAMTLAPWKTWKVITFNLDVVNVFHMQPSSRIYMYDGAEQIEPQLIKMNKRHNMIYVMPEKTYMKYQD